MIKEKYAFVLFPILLTNRLITPTEKFSSTSTALLRKQAARKQFRGWCIAYF